MAVCGVMAGLQIVDGMRDDQLAAGEAEGAVEGVAATQHDDLVLHAGGVGQLTDILRIGAGDAAGGGRGHGARGAGGDHGGFGAGDLCEIAPAAACSSNRSTK